MTVEPSYKTVALPYLAFEAVAHDNASHTERVIVAGRVYWFGTHKAVHAVQAVHTVRNHHFPPHPSGETRPRVELAKRQGQRVSDVEYSKSLKRL